MQRREAVFLGERELPRAVGDDAASAPGARQSSHSIRAAALPSFRAATANGHGLRGKRYALRDWAAVGKRFTAGSFAAQQEQE